MEYSESLRIPRTLKRKDILWFNYKLIKTKKNNRGTKNNSKMPVSGQEQSPSDDQEVSASAQKASPKLISNEVKSLRKHLGKRRQRKRNLSPRWIKATKKYWKKMKEIRKLWLAKRNNVLKKQRRKKLADLKCGIIPVDTYSEVQPATILPKLPPPEKLARIMPSTTPVKLETSSFPPLLPKKTKVSFGYRTLLVKLFRYQFRRKNENQLLLQRKICVLLSRS